METSHCSLSKIINNKQVVVYGALELTNDLRSVFVAHIHVKKNMKFRKINEIFHCCISKRQKPEIRNKEQEIRFLLIIFIRTTLRMENMVQRNFKRHFEFRSFIEIFCCGMTRLRKTELGVFIQCQYTRTILRNRCGTESV